MRIHGAPYLPDLNNPRLSGLQASCRDGPQWTCSSPPCVPLGFGTVL
jgi:hypothetical protein